MVGLGRFELPTSRLSGVRSNQLSYRPAGRIVSIGSKDQPATCRSVDCHRTRKSGSLKTEQERQEDERLRLYYYRADSFRPQVTSIATLF
jgi:hypothetical protein